MTDTRDPFDPGAVAPETAAFNAQLEAALAAMPPVHKLPPALTRKARAEGRGVFPVSGPLPGSDWHDIPGAEGGPGRVRISDPDGATRGTYLHIHGGGWTLGSPDQYDQHNQRIARATGCRVVSVQYRLAPEHPWPACAEDCEAAALWALAECPGPLLIGGESAGAHLSVVTLLRLRGADQAGRVAGMVLNYGVFDLRMTPSMANWGPRYLILSTPVTRWFVDNLLPGGDPAAPTVSPLLDGLGALPRRRRRPHPHAVADLLLPPDAGSRAEGPSLHRPAAALQSREGQERDLPQGSVRTRGLPDRIWPRRHDPDARLR
jgi:acetyl esterase/lipase